MLFTFSRERRVGVDEDNAVAFGRHPVSRGELFTFGIDSDWNEQCHILEDSL